MGDDHDQALLAVNHQRLDAFHRQIQVLGIERTEPFVKEERIEPPSPATDHFGQTERQTQRGEKGLTPGQTVSPANRVGRAQVDDVELPVLGEAIPSRREAFEMLGSQNRPEWPACRSPWAAACGRHPIKAKRHVIIGLW